jgi:hypothetical protein
MTAPEEEVGTATTIIGVFAIFEQIQGLTLEGGDVDFPGDEADHYASPVLP